MSYLPIAQLNTAPREGISKPSFVDTESDHPNSVPSIIVNPSDTSSLALQITYRQCYRQTLSRLKM
jgi:hypothetical protein